MSQSPFKIQRSEAKQDVKSGVASLVVDVSTPMDDTVPLSLPTLQRQKGSAFASIPFSSTSRPISPDSTCSEGSSSKLDSDDDNEEEEEDGESDCNDEQVDDFSSFDHPHSALMAILHAFPPCISSECKFFEDAQAFEVDMEDPYVSIANWLEEMHNTVKCRRCRSKITKCSELLGSPGFP